MKPLLLIGRNDGIGNRVEEIALFIALCKKKGRRGLYFWNNLTTRSDRRYPLLLTLDVIDLSSSPLSLLTRGIKINRELFSGLTAKEIQEAYKHIKPTVKMEPIEAAGIHIRRGNRINTTSTHVDYSTVDESNECIRHTAQLLNKLMPPRVYICSDDEHALKNLKTMLNDRINILSPAPVHDRDFYEFLMLSNCQCIYMSSKFSSYAVTASMLNGIPLISYFPTTSSNLSRYNANVIYKPLRQT